MVVKKKIRSGSSENKSRDVVLELRDVWRTYTMGENKVHALRGLNLKVYKGEFLCILGPSGSGKSTMMNMIGVLDRPIKGNVFLRGHNINKFSESKLAQLRGKQIGFIFQKFNLINTLSAKENIILPLIFQGVGDVERNRRADELLDLVGLESRKDHKPGELSGGQQQRVAIARALAVDPEIILADEPTGNLDSSSGMIVMDFLEKLHREQGKTIILVTHDTRLTKFAQRVETLRDGMIVGEKLN
jgi:putative ABC transport system ATP-binding protein